MRILALFWGSRKLRKQKFMTFSIFFSCCMLLFSCSFMSNSVTPWIAACQVSLSFTVSRSLLKLMLIELMMPSNDLILCHPLLILPSVFPSTGVFSNESAVCIRWPKYWSFSFSISSSSVYSGLIYLGLTDLILLSKGLSRVLCYIDKIIVILNICLNLI